MAPGVTQINVYDGASLSNDDILATINRWVTDDLTTQASFSAGECELLAFATGFTDALDVTLMQAAAQGQSLFVSSGDTGVFCSAVVGVNGVPAGIPSVEYPASSPYAVGVGGTTVLGSGPNEIGWYAGGGGISYFESAPAFQSGVGGSFLGVNRGVPDVSLDADPNSGYTVIVAGQPETIGGTSASAPAWQGIWARVQGARGPLGFANNAPVRRAGVRVQRHHARRQRRRRDARLRLRDRPRHAEGLRARRRLGRHGCGPAPAGPHSVWASRSPGIRTVVHSQPLGGIPCVSRSFSAVALTRSCWPRVRRPPPPASTPSA